MCSRAWRAQWPGFDSARARPPTKELCLIIPTHMMNREIIPGRKKRVRRVLYKLWPCRRLDLAVSSLPAAPMWVEVNRLGWPLAGPLLDSRSRLEGARYRNTRQAAHSYLACFPRMSLTHTHTHLPIPFLSLGKRTGPLYGFSAGVQSRLDPCPQRTNERTEEGRKEE